MSSTSRPLRPDAERNRERIIHAARAVFAEQGINASTNEIARRAGVGIATLFRRFPQRPELVSAVFEQKLASYAAAIDAGLSNSDPYQGFCGFLAEAFSLQTDDQGFADVLTLTFPDAPSLEEERFKTSASLAELIERAKASGQLRSDFVQQDVALFLMANAGVLNATRASAPEAWARLLGYLLQSLSAEHAQPLPPTPSKDQMHEAMRWKHT